MPGSGGESRRSLLAAAVFVGLAAAFWLYPLRGGQALFYDVLFQFFYCWTAFLKEALAQGDLPLWNPHLFSGLPFAANMQSALFYPFTYLFVVLDFPAAAALNTALHALLAAGGAYLLARSLELGWEASVLAGVLFSCNGFFTHHYAFTSHYQSYVWLPFVAWAWLAFLRAHTPRRAAATALFLALQLLAGHPQFVFYSAAALALMTLGRDRRPRAFALLAGVGLWALAIAAVQLLPTLELAQLSQRGAGLGYDWATSYSLSPRLLFGMLLGPLWNRYLDVAGGDTHVIGFYFGLPALALAAWGCRRRANAAVWAGLTLIGLLLALGKHLPLYRVLYAIVPPLQWFRFPAQAAYLACLGVAILAAYGLERVKAPRLRLAAIVLCAADLWLFAQGSIETIDAAFFAAETPAIAFLRERAGQGRVLVTPRTRGEHGREGSTRLQAWLRFKDSLYPNVAMAHGLDEAAGREELTLARYDKVMESLYADPRSPWMHVLGIRHILSFWDMPREFPLVYSSWLRIHENPRALPRAYFVPDAVHLADGTTEDFVARTPGHDFRSRVLLEGAGAQTPGAGRGGFAAVPFSKHSPDFVALELDAPRDGWLVLADAYAPGWKASVNGRPAAVLRANAVQRAVAVPEGRSRVEFRYKPLSFLIGALLSLVGLALAFALTYNDVTA